VETLEKKPEKRFSSAREFSKELSKLLDGAEIKVPSDSESDGIIKFCRDYPGIVFLFSLLTIGGGYFLWKLKGAPNSQIPPVSTVISPNPVATSNKKIIPAINTEKKEGISDLVPLPMDLQPILPEENPNQEIPKKAAPSQHAAITHKKTESPSSGRKKRNIKRNTQDSSTSDPGIDDAAKSFFR
jgi:hypothetical protein